LIALDSTVVEIMALVVLMIGGVPSTSTVWFWVPVCNPRSTRMS
jgi:hypothetical protein